MISPAVESVVDNVAEGELSSTFWDTEPMVKVPSQPSPQKQRSDGFTMLPEKETWTMSPFLPCIFQKSRLSVGEQPSGSHT